MIYACVIGQSHTFTFPFTVSGVKSAYIDGDNSAESEEAYSLVKRKEARVWDLYFKIWGVRIKPALLYGEIEEIIEEYAPYIN